MADVEYGFRYRDPESRWLGICPANESFARAAVGSDPETWELWERTRAVPAGGWCLSGSEAVQPEPQGEPSDAATRVALAEFYYTRPGRTQLDAMRDAIRAAAGTAEQGKEPNV